MTSCIGFLISMFGTRMCGQTLLFIVIANGAIQLNVPSFLLHPHRRPQDLFQSLLDSCDISFNCCRVPGFLRVAIPCQALNLVITSTTQSRFQMHTTSDRHINLSDKQPLLTEIVWPKVNARNSGNRMLVQS